MKKIVYLLVLLCMGGIGFAQSYNYDRIPQEQQASSVWFSVTVEGQEVSLPSVASYGRLTLLEQEVDLEDIILQFQQKGEYPTRLQVTTTLKDGVDGQFRKDNPIQFLLEENGETIVSIQGDEKEYTLSYLIKMVWKDLQGEVHQKCIGKIY